MVNKLSRKKLEGYYAALGRFVSEWAAVEHLLELLLLVLARKERVKLPHQLADKIKTIRRAVRSSQSKHADAILRLVDQVEALADERHDYIHGAVMWHDVTRSRLTVTLARFLQPPHKPRRPPAKVTSEQLNRTADKLRTIGDSLLDLADALNREG